MPVALVWFRNDLRLDDQPALQAAFAQGYAPVPVHIADDVAGAASEAWRARSLAALDAALRTRGSRMVFAAGPSLETLQRLAAECGAEAVFWTRRHEPDIDARDEAIRRALRKSGLRAESFGGALLVEPWNVATQHGDPYKVFTAFWRTARARIRIAPAWQAPARFPEVRFPAGDAPAWEQRWDRKFWNRWTPGEAGARARLAAFVANAAGYFASRDFPALDGTSHLSPHLHFGEISVHRVFATIEDDAFRRQLGWREFAYHLLHHFPHTTSRNLDPRFDDFAWAPFDEERFVAWKTGRTGVPIVDAGMRQLWETGWMHNRVRMLVASLLVKHLRMHWSHGAAWFMETLVDADLANNTLGWQWVAGTGADAAPYHRIFNPMLQAKRFDPDGKYVKRWNTYEGPPIVDLAQAREQALLAHRGLRRPGSPPSRGDG